MMCFDAAGQADAGQSAPEYRRQCGARGAKFSEIRTTEMGST
jgi:hypothetical protein